MKKINILLFFVFIFFSYTHTAYGHGTGASLEKISGDYKIDIGYTPPVIEEGSSAALDFSLSRNDNGEEIEFTDIWVRIEKNQKTVFASGIHKPNFGRTLLTYTFPEAGEYKLNVRYQNNSTKLAEEVFSLSVVENKTAQNGLNKTAQNGLNKYFIVAIAGLAGGLLTGFVFANKRTSKNKKQKI
ncbi:MAG: hypothetical protein WDZ40_01430 [Candidatus Spechtbacterales bacterium]